jgi:hypothetical protein
VAGRAADCPSTPPTFSDFERRGNHSALTTPESDFGLEPVAQTI